MPSAGSEHDGATPLSSDDAEGLLPTYLTTRRQLNEFEADNIRRGRQWAVRVRPRRVWLTEDYILALHRRMFDLTWTWAGNYRRSNTNIGENWWTLPEKTREFCLDVVAWIASGTMSAGTVAVRLHHRLVQIHPFPNGNGRHARLLADLYLREKEPPLRWTQPGLDPSANRRRYIAALQDADKGDFTPLLRFCGVQAVAIQQPNSL